MMKLLFSPSNRIGPADFQKGALVLIVIAFLVALLPLVGSSPLLVTLGGLIGLVLLYPWVCIWIKRLHDAGKSGWFIILAIIAWMIVNAIVGMIVVQFFGGGAAFSSDPQGLQDFFSQISQQSRANALPNAIAGAVVSLIVVFAANALLSSDPGDNQYGPPA